MKKDCVFLIGAGNHAKIILSALGECGMCCSGIYDDNKELWGSTVWGIPVLGAISEMPDEAETMAVIAIGSNEARKKIASRFEKVCWPIVVHPQTSIHSSVRIGEGTVIMPGAIVLADTVIGKHCIINTSAAVNQDSDIGDFCHIGMRCAVADGVKIGEGSFVGMVAVIIPHIRIEENVMVGAGGVVIRNLDKDGRYVGNPVSRILLPVLKEESTKF